LTPSPADNQADQPQSANDPVTPSDHNDLIAPGGKVDPDLLRAAHLQNENTDLTIEDEDGPPTVHFKLTRDLNKRLDKYLQDRISFLSRTQLQRLIREKAVTVNGKSPKASTTLRIDDEITVILPPPPTNEIPAENIPLTVLYEDNDLIVINKQDDIIVHPARGNKTGTIVNALSYHFKHNTSGSLSTVGSENARPGIVHRLDRHTTGALIAAKSDTAHWRLGQQFEIRTVDKRYLAIVEGAIEPVMDTIDLPIGKHPKFRERMAVRFDDTAKSATTVYRLREQFDGYALLELELKTGRTHQIRVHLAHLGWPIVADDIYGGSFLNENDINPDALPDHPLMLRQALHARTIAFTHPITGKHLQFIAPLPDDFRRLLKFLYQYKRINHPITPPGATIELDQLNT